MVVMLPLNFSDNRNNQLRLDDSKHCLTGAGTLGRKKHRGMELRMLRSPYPRKRPLCDLLGVRII